VLIGFQFERHVLGLHLPHTIGYLHRLLVKALDLKLSGQAIERLTQHSCEYAADHATNVGRKRGCLVVAVEHLAYDGACEDNAANKKCFTCAHREEACKEGPAGQFCKGAKVTLALVGSKHQVVGNSKKHRAGSSRSDQTWNCSVIGLHPLVH